MNVAELFGKVGYGAWRSKSRTVGLDSVVDNGRDYVYGAGLGLNVSKHVGLRLEWEQSEVDDVEVSFVSAGFVLSVD